jgi:hypothetical protein
MSIQTLHLTRPAITVLEVHSSLTRAGQVSFVVRLLKWLLAKERKLSALDVRLH